ncbi:jg21692, partial [Pararge aegeria aegeria]
IDRPHVLRVESELATILSTPPDGEPLAPTTCDEVHTIIKGFHAKKAPGPDGISIKTLKLLPGQIINLLVVIFNVFLANCYFPDKWKEATVIAKAFDRVWHAGLLYKARLVRLLRAYLTDRTFFDRPLFTSDIPRDLPASVKLAVK